MNRAKVRPPVTEITEAATDLEAAWAALLARLERDGIPAPTRGQMPETLDEITEFERVWRMHAR